VQVNNNAQDESGRILRIDLNLLGTPSTLIGAYSPAQQEERDFFFSELLPSSLPPQGARKILLAGDFNYIISEENDVFYPPDHPGLRQRSTRLHGSAGLSRLMKEHNLVDIWRDQHPAELTLPGGNPVTRGESH
jgi:exonuclease III